MQLGQPEVSKVLVVRWPLNYCTEDSDGHIPCLVNLSDQKSVNLGLAYSPPRIRLMQSGVQIGAVGIRRPIGSMQFRPNGEVVPRLHN